MFVVAAVVFASAFAKAPSPIRIEGNKVVNSRGQTVKFHGINVCSMEWTAPGDHVLQSIPVALDKWGANLIRLPLCQDRWFGKTPDSPDGGAPYRKLVAAAVKEAEVRGKYILLDLHWNDCDVWGQNIGQHNLPDQHSLEFWKSCAKAFANRPGVMFDLYNEPIKGPWETWRNGGPVTEEFQGKTLSYQAVGFQTLLEAIRGVGAKNVVVAGGLGYASQLDGLDKYKLVDPGGRGVLYANHFYPGWESVSDWEKRMIPLEKKWPILIGEFGADPQSLPLDDPQRRAAQVLAILKKENWSWSAWCMHTAATPCLISDWNYTPTPYYGALVYKALHGESVPIPPRPTTASDKVVYDDKLENEFQYWGSAKVDFASGLAHSGAHSIQVDAAAGTQVMLGDVPFDGRPYRAIEFWVNGGDQGGQKLQLSANVMDTQVGQVDLPALQANTWTKVDVSFDALGIADKENVKSFAIRSADGQALPTFYVDDVVILGRR